MDIYFNELSIQQATHSATAKEWMSSLIQVYKKAKEENGFNSLKTSKQIFDENLAPNYTIRQWLNDRSVNRDEQSLFRQIATKSPYIDEMLDSGIKDEDGLVEFRYNAKTAKGLGAASLFSSLSISFDNDNEWDKTEIPIIKYSVTSEETIEKKLIVKHVSKSTHFKEHTQWIKDKTSAYIHDIQNGKELWLKKGDIFPHLLFCENVKKQIDGLNKNQPQFIQIKERLSELEMYCADWKSSVFDSKAMPTKTTPESETRINELGDKLKFQCPNGEKKLFSWHLRYTPGKGRVHICPDDKNRIIYIGYIGEKIL
ncbi:hypothetical protein MCHI_004052 [Candidatus Magnetoovum chiemensis]|nr:hypothetical protein MCHI_004052 [Candidatus Magnetoovum chiemensis]